MVILSKLISKELVIPNFSHFCQHIQTMYDKCEDNTDGQVACYIPQLARYSPDNWALSVCTVDGQRFSLGQVDTPFTMQSCSKPFTYGICLNELGDENVHRFIGHEPSGRNFNEICLDSTSKIFNRHLLRENAKCKQFQISRITLCSILELLCLQLWCQL